MARFVSTPETFLVEEQPAYVPAGEGPHTFVWIEKRGLTTLDAVARLARSLGVDNRDVGYAGMKDRNATTRQWLSLPDIEPTLASAVEIDGLRVLQASRHRNKLRVGHLRGNRFEVVLGEVSPDERASLETRLQELARQGLPNRYGHQRFGAAGDNLQVGLEILRGTRRERDHRRRKLLLSAVQSAVFNRVLELRDAGGGLCRVRLGDILQKTESGGSFVCEDAALDQARVDAGELVPTAPLPGGRFMQPPTGTPARDLEDQAVADLGIGPNELAEAGRDLPGTRRPVVIPVTLGQPSLEDVSPDSVRLHFSLPAGGYATVLLSALGVQQGTPRNPEQPASEGGSVSGSVSGSD
jgi:tRNA pseudouridine13 synthase